MTFLAEAFANYVHVVMMQRPYRITMTAGGKTVATYEACWLQPRCAAKRKIIEQFLGVN